MKKISLLILTSILAIPMFAGTKLISGSFLEMRNERNIPVYLDWSDAVYGKSGNLDDFINKATREANWEEASLAYFIKEFNKRAGEYGVSVANPEEATATQYSIIVKTYVISKGGDIKGTILLMKEGEKNPLGIVEFSSDESDDDDKIAFRDQLENVGENFGKIVQKELKKSSK